jgi:hypothetical protein
MLLSVCPFSANAEDVEPSDRGHESAPTVSVPSFAAEVMAVLSKAGCNAGTCHGNQNGKGGFKLSLRGQDPAFDFLALSRDQFGRRANPLDPEQSLVLLKPSMQIAHEGGLRHWSLVIHLPRAHTSSQSFGTVVSTS